MCVAGSDPDYSDPSCQPYVVYTFFLFILFLSSRNKDLRLRFSRATRSSFRITIERRYTNKERFGATTDEVKDCNTLSGVKVLGLQERDIFSLMLGDLRLRGLPEKWRKTKQQPSRAR